MKKMFLILMAVVAATISGCGSKVQYGISEGTYEMEYKEGFEILPTVRFIMEEDKNGKPIQQFILSYNAGTPTTYTGEFELDGKVNLISKGDKKFIFEVVDNDTIKFVEKGSDEIVEDGPHIEDGTEFIYVEKN